MESMELDSGISVALGRTVSCCLQGDIALVQLKVKKKKAYATLLCDFSREDIADICLPKMEH